MKKFDFSDNLIINNVSAFGQTNGKSVFCYKKSKGIKILFVGNSITLHKPNTDIGWNGNWGMAASCAQKDYVHVTVNKIEEIYGETEFCIVQSSEWEREFENFDYTVYSEAKNFRPDIIIMRLGENVDPNKFAEDKFKRYYNILINCFKGKNTKVIVTDLFWESPALDSLIKKTAIENNYGFLHLGDLGFDEKMKAGNFEHKGVALHPSDKGMEQIAERIIAAIKVII